MLTNLKRFVGDKEKIAFSRSILALHSNDRFYQNILGFEARGSSMSPKIECLLQ